MKEKNNNTLLKDLNKVFTSNIIDINEKQNLMKLKKVYTNNLKLNNIEELENKLYNNRTKREKIIFEIDRIKKKLIEEKNNNYNNILNYLENILKNNEQSEQFYDDILQSIIQIEWELGMNIALFKEFNLYFENEVIRSLEIINHASNEYDSNKLKR